MGALTDPREEAACAEYVLNGGQGAAAYAVGMGKRCARWKQQTINSYACRFFARGDVKERVAELQAEVAEIAEKKFKVDAAYVLQRLVEVDQMDAADILDDHGNVRPVREWPKVWRQFISGMDLTELTETHDGERQSIGFMKKIKWPDKIKNLELLGKHVAVQAFKEKLEINEVPEVEALSDEDLNAEIERRLTAAASSSAG